MTEILTSSESGSLRARVFAVLEQAIINGEYKEGDMLNELRLTKELGVSRTPIREALTQLELEGLVKNIQNKGAVVVGVSQKDIEDIYAIRLRLDGFAARLAAENITDDQLDRLEQAVELQSFYAEKSDTENVRRFDSEFHNAIYEASNNRPLCAMLKSFHNQIRRARGISLGVSGRSAKSIEEHRGIFEAIKAHDADRAEALMTEHIQNAFANFKGKV